MCHKMMCDPPPFDISPFLCTSKNGCEVAFSVQLPDFSDKLHFYLASLYLHGLVPCGHHMSILAIAAEYVSWYLWAYRGWRNLKSIHAQDLQSSQFQYFCHYQESSCIRPFLLAQPRRFYFKQSWNLKREKCFRSLMSTCLQQFCSVQKLPHPTVMSCSSKACDWDA